ncbi:MAG: hypothetical protein Alis3KO_36260 [Aliiglaciecola sp.]
MSSTSDDSFQSTEGVIRWKLHFSSSPEKVYLALSTDEGRRGYWAESADETNGKIHYVFLNDIEDTGEILERTPNKTFSVMYFGWKTTFNLCSDGNSGTDLEMVAEGIPDADKMEITAGWVSWLMAMKASVDFGVDLRNHDAKRSWFDGYADN